VNFQEVVHSAQARNADVARQKRFAEDRMDTHKNAHLTPKGREQMVRAVMDSGMSKAAAARQFNTTSKTVAKWVDRFKADGVDGLRDRSSRPLSSPVQTPLATCAAVEMLRRQRYTGRQIAAELRISPATVSRILRRSGLNSLKALEPAEPVRRYECEHPGELIHIDIKKLGRFDSIGHRITGDRKGQSYSRGRGEAPGWEFVHVCIDDASRVAFVQIKPDQKKESAVAFLKAAVVYYESLGVRVARVMTDNGGCYMAGTFRDACRKLGLRHIRTKPFSPKTNGKAERFIQTALREWAYAQAYTHSDRRNEELPHWLHRYNWHRPHGSLRSKPPISRLGLSEDNLLRLHI
jgi:transposase InsO family protein